MTYVTGAGWLFQRQVYIEIHQIHWVDRCVMAKLTDQQFEFVTKFTSVPAAIGNASEAARQAGYSARSAAEIGRQLLEKPHVQTAIREANQRLISGQIATKAVALLERVID